MELLSHEQIESLMIGDYKIIQSNLLYRFTSDAVMLTHFAKAKKGDVVLDVCSGSGIVGLNFFALNQDLIKSVTLCEMQPALAQMSQRTVILNGLESKFSVINSRLQDLEPSLNGAFSLVLCNPPYKKADSGLTGDDYEIAVCKHEITVNINDICAVASRVLKNGGRLVLCNKTERLADVICALDQNGLSPERLVFCHGTERSKPYLFMIEAFKGVKKQLKVLAPIINNAKTIG